MNHAMDRNPCRACGVPGFRGCEHQLAYVPLPIPAFRDRARQARPREGRRERVQYL